MDTKEIHEIQMLEILVLDLFRQGTYTDDRRYDHQHLSVYKEAQEYLVEHGLIKITECVRT